LRINQQIRAKAVRVIGVDGKQVGVMSVDKALEMAKEAGVDLVEVVSKADPVVCKLIDYGKFKYDQTKREREGKKAQHQVKVKELKFKPNIDKHDLEYKKNRARQFLEKGNKVRLNCTFRGREMLHKDIGKGVMQKVCDELADIAAPESPLKLLGRSLTVVLAPNQK
jgi:translation initiation factor IF-3